MLGTGVGLGVLGLASPSWAPTAVERTVFGLVGLAAGQTLRLNVVAFRRPRVR